MKNIIQEINKINKRVCIFVKKHWDKILLFLFILVYIIYFSCFTILRFKTLHAHYYDLGIMHQTVFNTYKGIATLDFSRILELTDPSKLGSGPIKRMAIHNDILLFPLALFYFIHSGPETLLILQTVIIALGAIGIYLISKRILSSKILSITLAFSYLMYFPLQRANIFEFHAVSLATSFLIIMFYFFLVKKYKLSFIFFLLSLFSKENVALVTLLFGTFILLKNKSKLNIFWGFINKILHRGQEKKDNFLFGLIIFTISIVWFVLSILIIIPYFRGSTHFALARYSQFGDSFFGVFMGLIKNPVLLFSYIFCESTIRYLFYLLAPLGFLSLFSPIYLLIALPQLAINLLSSFFNTRSFYYHYTSLITPFVFISAIYGCRNIVKYIERKYNLKREQVEKIIAVFLLFSTLSFSYLKSPLPYSKEKDGYYFAEFQRERKDVEFWAKTLKSESYIVSSTQKLAPLLASRRYYYDFGSDYVLADFVLILIPEISVDWESKGLIDVYNNLKNNKNFVKIHENGHLEVYKRK